MGTVFLMVWEIKMGKRWLCLGNNWINNLDLICHRPATAQRALLMKAFNVITSKLWNLSKVSMKYASAASHAHCTNSDLLFRPPSVLSGILRGNLLCCCFRTSQPARDREPHMRVTAQAQQLSFVEFQRTATADKVFINKKHWFLVVAPHPRPQTFVTQKYDILLFVGVSLNVFSINQGILKLFAPSILNNPFQTRNCSGPFLLRKTKPKKVVQYWKWSHQHKSQDNHWFHQQSLWATTWLVNQEETWFTTIIIHFQQYAFVFIALTSEIIFSLQPCHKPAKGKHISCPMLIVSSYGNFYLKLIMFSLTILVFILFVHFWRSSKDTENTPINDQWIRMMWGVTMATVNAATWEEQACTC